MARRLGWIAMTTLGLVVAGFLFHFPGSYGEPTLNVSAGVFGLLIGALSGVMVGSLQVLGARPVPCRRRATVLAATLSVAITHAVMDGSARTIPLGAYAAVAGVATAAAYGWLFTIRSVPVVVLIGVAWAVGLAVAAVAGDAIGFPLEETPVGWASDHAFDGLVVGLVWGVATAFGGLADRLWVDTSGEPEPFVSAGIA